MCTCTCTCVNICHSLLYIVSNFPTFRGLCPQNKDTNTPSSRNQDDPSTEGRGQTSFSNRSRSRGAITDGSLVRLKNGPPCGPNSIVYSVSPYGPRVGKTMNIIEHGSLDPKTSVLVKVFKDEFQLNARSTSRKKKHKVEFGFSSQLLPDLEDNSNYNGLEVWKLSNVVFLDDSPAILGRVVTVDYPQVIVDISHSTNESGTLASSSNAKSTLKVFKVSELELCPIDYGECDQIHKKKASSSSSSSEGAKFSTLGQDTGVSHHVAGTVQHHPVCILAPEVSSHDSFSGVSGLPPSTLQQHPGDSIAPSSRSLIYGYAPLAVHTTDKGLTMLLERISDGSTYLVYSGHSSGAGGLVSTSFVALNSKDSKPNRHTVEEESVPAVEGGFKADPVALQYRSYDDHTSKQLCRIGKNSAEKVDVRSKVRGHKEALAPSPVDIDSSKSALPQRRSTRKRRLAKSVENTTSSPDKKSSCEPQPLDTTSNKTTKGVCTTKSPVMSNGTLLPHQDECHYAPHHPLPKINSQLLLIRDVNGKLCPLLDGLNLRPVPGKLNVALPTMSYRCVAFRQYAVSSNQNVTVVALGKSGT